MAKNASLYLKMQIMGAIEFAEGRTIRDRIKTVSRKTFFDEDGLPRRFTWRTIETWQTRYKKHGVTIMESKSRCDQGKTRKIHPEKIYEAVEKARGAFKDGKPANKAALYRVCIEKGLLRREEIAPNTFSRLCNQYERISGKVF